MQFALTLPSAFGIRLPFAAAPRPAAVVQRTTVALAKRGFHAEHKPLGMVVQCLSGCLWLTQDGDDRDTVLEAGQIHTCDRRTRLIVHALDASTLAISRP